MPNDNTVAPTLPLFDNETFNNETFNDEALETDSPNIQGLNVKLNVKSNAVHLATPTTPTTTPSLLSQSSTSNRFAHSTSTIYLGTGGYSDTDLLGTLYPADTKKADLLREYAKNYGAVEINSSFYAPIGQKAFAGMLNKAHVQAQSQLRFAVKLHQDFTHARRGTIAHAQAFLHALTPLIEADCLAPLLLQFPHGFDRTRDNRLYLATLVSWFKGYPLAIEFRHASWHNPQVVDSFNEQGLIWCSVDYPKVNGLPPSQLLFTQRTGYLRMHGNNPNWWDAMSAADRHDYRYSEAEMNDWAQVIATQRQHFDTLYVFFQNTVKAHAVYNIAMLREALGTHGFKVL